MIALVPMREHPEPICALRDPRGEFHLGRSIWFAKRQLREFQLSDLPADDLVATPDAFTADVDPFLRGGDQPPRFVLGLIAK